MKEPETLHEKIEILGDISPVEAYFLINERDVSYKLLLQYTLSHLIAIDVLEAKPVFKSPKKTNRVSRLGNIQFRLGKNYQYYDSLPHEEIFLNAFKGDADVKFYFKHYIMTLNEHIGTKGFFVKELLLKTLEQRGYYANKPLRRILGLKARLTVAGKKKKEQLARLQILLNRELPRLIQTASTEADSVIKKLGATVLVFNVKVDELQGCLDRISKDRSAQGSTEEPLFSSGWYLLNSEFDVRFEALFKEGIKSVFHGFVKADIGCGGCGA